MKVYIVEDSLFDLEDIKITLEELGHKCVGASGDPFEAQEQIGEILPDVVLVDIHLNGKQSGIALGRKVKSLYQLPIVFASADCRQEVIEEAADIDPVAYLTKPINKKDLQAALVLAGKQMPSRKTRLSGISSLFVKSGNRLVKIGVDVILFAYTDSKNYSTFVTNENKKFSVRRSIVGLHQLLGDDIFVQTHRSYIVNWKKIDSFYESDQTIEVQGHHVPLGRTFKGKVYARLKVI